MGYKTFYIAAAALFLHACSQDLPLPAADPILPGGNTTIFSSGADAFTFPLANASAATLQRHFAADQLFEQAFVTLPAEVAGGLGPLYIANACSNCHLRNGRGSSPLLTQQTDGVGLLLRMSVPGSGLHNTNLPVPGFGTQLQTKAIFGEVPEGRLHISWTTTTETLADGTQIWLQQPAYTVADPYLSLPAFLQTSPRMASAVFGLGLVEAINESDILALADPNDANGDGISGRANWVWDIEKNEIALGRFGWKAGNPTLQQQTADAYHQDMGVTSQLYFPIESSAGQSNGSTGVGPEPDISREEVDLTAFYCQTLGVPAFRQQEEPHIQAGARLFEELGCNQCHVPAFTTGYHELPELRYQTIYPYSDFLLHDMGEGLADHRPEYEAGGTEWRTPPLWGIGLTKTVNNQAGYLHDGRAQTIEEAILWHAGEANTARNAYRQLSSTERQQLLAFIESL